MFRSNPGVRRPVLYIIAAALGIALVIPLAVYSGQMTTGGIFDECFGDSCATNTVLADVR